MPTAEIKKWLKARRRQAFILSMVFCIVGLMGGLIVLLPAFFLVYVTAKLMVLLVAPTSQFVNAWSCGLTLLGVGLIYVDIFFSERDDMSILPQWLFREFIHAGPRLTLDGGRQIFRAWGLAHLDIESCAKALSYLASKTRSASKEELLQTFPELVWAKLIIQLRLLEGILFLRPDVSRLSLTASLRLELLQFGVQTGKQEIFEEATVAVNEPEKLTPHEILGVTPAASTVEIKIAYRRRVKECHPDHFAGADATARELAEEWTKALNTAYETLLVQSRNATVTKR